MPSERVAAQSDLQPGQLMLVHVETEDVCLANVDGEIVAFNNECTHVGGPLNEGTLEGSEVECPWHGSRFNVRTGEVTEGPADEPIKVYTVTIQGDDIFVEAG